MVIEMEERMSPLLLGRPFQATGDVIIEMGHGRLTLGIEGDRVEYKLPTPCSRKDVPNCQLMPHVKNVELFLGQPFLVTAQLMTQVKANNLKINIIEKDVVVNLQNTMKQPAFPKDSYSEELEEKWDFSVEEILCMDLLFCNFIDGDNEQENSMEVADKGTSYAVLATSFYSHHIEDLGELPLIPKPSLEAAPELNLKTLPLHLKYIYLGKDKSFPVISIAHLTGPQEEKLLGVPRRTELLLDGP